MNERTTKQKYIDYLVALTITHASIDCIEKNSKNSFQITIFSDPFSAYLSFCYRWLNIIIMIINRSWPHLNLGGAGVESQTSLYDYQFNCFLLLFCCCIYFVKLNKKLTMCVCYCVLNVFCHFLIIIFIALQCSMKHTSKLFIIETFSAIYTLEVDIVYFFFHQEKKKGLKKSIKPNAACK